MYKAIGCRYLNCKSIHEYSDNLIIGDIQGDGLKLNPDSISGNDQTIDEACFIVGGTVNAGSTLSVKSRLDIVGTLTNRGIIHHYSNAEINGNIRNEGDGLKLIEVSISDNNQTIGQASFIQDATVNAGSTLKVKNRLDILGTLTNRGKIYHYSNAEINGEIKNEGDGLKLDEVTKSSIEENTISSDETLNSEFMDISDDFTIPSGITLTIGNNAEFIFSSDLYIKGTLANNNGTIINNGTIYKYATGATSGIITGTGSSMDELQMVLHDSFWKSGTKYTLNTDESLNHQFIEINADESLHVGEPQATEVTLTMGSNSIIRNFGIIYNYINGTILATTANIQNKENRDTGKVGKLLTERSVTDSAISDTYATNEYTIKQGFSSIGNRTKFYLIDKDKKLFVLSNREFSPGQILNEGKFINMMVQQ